MCFFARNSMTSEFKNSSRCYGCCCVVHNFNPPSTPVKTLRRSKGCPFKVREGKRNGHVKSLCPRKGHGKTKHSKNLRRSCRKGRLDHVIFLSVGLYSSVPSLGTPSMIQSHHPLVVSYITHEPLSQKSALHPRYLKLSRYRVF